MKPRNMLFVVGLERSGTHTMCEVMRKACRNQFPCQHEAPPFLCQEAYHKFQYLKLRSNAVTQKIHQAKNNLCECNHRLSFFIEELAVLPTATFLLLVREPVDILRSRIMNLSFVHEVFHLLPEGLRTAMNDQQATPFNQFRIKPGHHNYSKAYQYYLYDLVETIRFAVSQLKKVRFQVHHISQLYHQFIPVLHMVEQTYEWDYDSAFRQTTIKHDATTADNRAAYYDLASDLVEPYRQEIETEFLKAFTGLSLSQTHLPEFLANPVSMMSRVL